MHFLFRLSVFLLLSLQSLEAASQSHRFLVTERFAMPYKQLKLWVPLPLESEYQKVSNLKVSGNFITQSQHSDAQNGAKILFLAFDPAETNNTLTLSFEVKVTDRQSDFDATSEPLDDENLSRYLAGSENLRIDGVVAEYAARITKNTGSDLARARAVYDWIVQNMFRDPAVRGCGLGNAYQTLESGYLGGKCADVSAVFVALLRASGVPAREVFGIRVAPSRYSKAYGVKSSDITTAQHCRGEFYIKGMGWIPADPADVTKLILVENLDRNSSRVQEEAARQFGSWEMNWFAYNSARDFVLTPKPVQFPLSIFSYPYAESGDEPLDYYDPAHFAYTITAEPLP